MPSTLDLLSQRKANILAELAAMGPTTAGGKPDSRDGGVSHVAYRKSLYEELAELNKQIAVAEGPWEETLELRP